MVSMDDMDTHPSTLSRRTLVAGAAWGVPAVMVVGAAPAMAASTSQPPVTETAETRVASDGWTPAAAGDLLSALASQGGTAAVNPSNTGTLVIGNFGFSIPATATIDSLVIRFRYYWVGGANGQGSFSVQARFGAANRGAAFERTGTNHPASATSFSQELDPTSFTVAELNSSDTRIAITSNKTNGPPIWYVDYVALEVTYSL